MDSRTISQLAFGGRTKQLIGQPYRRSSFRTRPYAPDQGTRNPSVYHSHGDQPKSKNTAIDGEDPEFSRPENTGHGKENVRAKLSARTLMASGRHMPDSAVFQRHPCRKGLFSPRFARAETRRILRCHLPSWRTAPPRNVPPPRPRIQFRPARLASSALELDGHHVRVTRCYIKPPPSSRGPSRYESQYQ